MSEDTMNKPFAEMTENTVSVGSCPTCGGPAQFIPDGVRHVDLTEKYRAQWGLKEIERKHAVDRMWDAKAERDLLSLSLSKARGALSYAWHEIERLSGEKQDDTTRDVLELIIYTLRTVDKEAVEKR